MGVTGLWKLIDQSGKIVPLDTLENKILAVDISIWLHQVVKGFQDSNGATLPHAHLLGLFHRLCKLMYYRIRPVFVFDGGVPPLKRETIAKRNRNKNKYQNEADKLQHLLLEALAKEKVVQQALGASTSALLSGSPPKKAIKNTDDEDNDLFKLPPVQDDLPKDDSYTDIGESDESFDEKQRVVYNHNLQAIDVKSSHFQSLPADIRHEILSDIKETRKQSSWGRLHELPAESQSFSSFQMKRLLKRRQVQVELEEAEKEMGGKGLSMAELENLLSEEGVVDPDLATERIASSDHIRYLHVRDITKALKKETEEKIKKEKLEKIKEEKEDEPNEKKMDKIKIVEHIKTEEMNDEDYDLQRAIQLSLGASDTFGAGSESDTVRLTDEQKKALGSAANSLARHYMIEYGGMNDEDVQDLVKIDENINTTQEFKFNDDSVLFGKGVSTSATSTSPNKTSFHAKEISKKLNVENEKAIHMSESSSDEAEVSSNADSDFIDVPEMDSEMDADDTFFMRSNFPLPPPFLMNQPPDVPLNAPKIEVVINPGQMSSIKDDIFADIFDKPDRSEIDERKMPLIEDEQNSINECDKRESTSADVVAKIDFIDLEEDQVELQKADVDSDIAKSIETEVTTAKAVDAMPNSKMQSILSELDKEKSAATKLSLDDLLGPAASKEIDELIAKKDTTLLDTMEKEPSADGMSTPKKIPQPFFVKKTPPSSTKKSPKTAKNEADTTPSKAAKSLSEAFDSVPSTSSTAKATAIDAKQSIEMAASVLRDKKSKEELEDIAEMLNRERQDLAAERNKKDRLGVSITEQMSMECMELLRLFGVPYVVAPMEAEAQCAYLNAINLTDGTITDDSDIWLFGGQTVYKNFFDQNKHVLEFQSDNIQRLFHLDRHKLIQLSFLVGSDYTEGIHGIGAVTALEVLSIFNQTPEKEGETTQIMSILSSLRKFREWWANKSVAQRANALRNKLKNITISEDFPNARVVEAYLFPTVDENREAFSWGKLEVESIREYAKKTFGWTNKRTDEIILPVVKRLGEKVSQQSIQNYFKVTGVTSRKDLQVSKRVRAAIQQMSGDPDSSIVGEEVVEKKKAKKKTTKKPSKKDSTDATAPVDDSDFETIEGDEKPKAKKEPKPKPKPEAEVKVKPKRKRKAQNEIKQEQQKGNDDPEASTSAAGPKKIVLPENPITAAIPQREKEKQMMESNRLKAIELLKKAKMSKKH